MMINFCNFPWPTIQQSSEIVNKRVQHNEFLQVETVHKWSLLFEFLKFSLIFNSTILTFQI